MRFSPSKPQIRRRPAVSTPSGVRIIDSRVSAMQIILPDRPARLAALPPHLIERLAAEGVHSLTDWRALGRRRHQVWGITRRMAAELDALAREVRP
jgi:hypothetical protein